MERSNEGIGKGNSSVIVWIYSRLQSIEKKNSGLGKFFLCFVLFTYSVCLIQGCKI